MKKGIKIILKYHQGFHKEIYVKELIPMISITMPSHIAAMPSHITAMPSHITAINQASKVWRFAYEKIVKEGFWIFKKPVAYYNIYSE